MAWTKTKTAIVTGVAALLLIGPAVTIVEFLLPASYAMKKYTGPINGKPLTSGMKRYVSPDGDFTVDLPNDWQIFSHIKKYHEIGKFRTPEEGLKAVFYAPSYSPWLTLEKRRDDQAKVNTRAGYRILGKSETILNGRNVLMLDTNEDTANIRNYFLKEGDYIYSVLFYAFNTEGIPADRVEGYERVMKSVNILKK